MGTLYVTEPGMTVAKQDQRLILRKGHEVLRDLPAIKVERIVIFGPGHLTTPAVHLALEQGIDVAYLSSSGQYHGHLVSGPSADGRLRQRQAQRLLDPTFRLATAKQIVTGKIHNAIGLCRRQRRRSKRVESSLERLGRLRRQAVAASSLDQLRGFEGAATAQYYRAFAEFLGPDWAFTHRRYRPSPDPVNALLSLGYSLLHNRLIGLITLHGLDPYQGVFHELKRGHAALASDLTEEWRAIIVDSLVLTLLKRRELVPRHFHTSRNKKGIRLSRKGLARFFQRFDRKTMHVVEHPRLGQQMAYGACMEEQVKQLKRLLLGQIEGYKPFEIGS